MSEQCGHEAISLKSVDHISSDGMVVCKAECEDCGERYLAECYPTRYRHTTDLTGASDLEGPR